MYKYLFGPVPSRRLGMSLGVDLVPRKVCTLDCVYCECGKTTKLTVERREYVPADRVIAELYEYLKTSIFPDYLTFSGSGEPTLNLGIGRIIEWIKEKAPELPVAVLTNGTLLSTPSVRKDLLKADVVIPSLDAAGEKSFIKTDRPHESLTIDSYIQGLADFRREYSGKIWLEVFILPGYNDSAEDLLNLKLAIEKINPDTVQLNTLDRPGTVQNIRAATVGELKRVVAVIGRGNVEIIKPAPERKDIKSYRKDTESAILETISRRPCTLVDLSSILGIHVNEINKYLGVLEEENKVNAEIQERGVFYTACR